MRSSMLPTVVALTTLALLEWGCGPSSASPTDQRDPERVVEYITSERYDRLVVEVDYVEGMRPDEQSSQALRKGLADLLDKPKGVEIRFDERLSPRGSDYGWRFDELRNLERRTFDLSVEARTIKMHVLFLDGHDARDDERKYLGLSWSNRNVVLFRQTIQNSCRSGSKKMFGLVDRLCQQAEQMIWTHEIGHVLGLVDYGLPMVNDHEDPDHPNHDSNDNCVMYWAFERNRAFDRIRRRLEDRPDSEALGFGPECRNDVAAVRSN